MNKKLLALKIVLPVFIILIAVLIVVELNMMSSYSDGENALATAISVLLVALIDVVTGVVMAIGGLLLVIATIMLLAAKNKLPATIFALVVLCLMVPVVGFTAYLNIAMLYKSVFVPIAAVALSLANIAGIVLCGMVINDIKKAKKIKPDVNITPENTPNFN